MDDKITEALTMWVTKSEDVKKITMDFVTSRFYPRVKNKEQVIIWAYISFLEDFYIRNKK